MLCSKGLRRELTTLLTTFGIPTLLTLSSPSLAIASPALADRHSFKARDGENYTVFEHAATRATMSFVTNSGNCETTPGVNQYFGYHTAWRRQIPCPYSRRRSSPHGLKLSITMTELETSWKSLSCCTEPSPGGDDKCPQRTGGVGSLRLKREAGFDECRSLALLVMTEGEYKILRQRDWHYSPEEEETIIDWFPRASLFLAIGFRGAFATSTESNSTMRYPPISDNRHVAARAVSFSVKMFDHVEVLEEAREMQTALTRGPYSCYRSVRAKNIQAARAFERQLSL
jgi:hypothetical protein